MDEQKRMEIELIRNSSPLDDSEKCVLHFYDTQSVEVIARMR